MEASIRQNASYEVYEEVGCVSSDGSTRRADIIIIDRQKDKGVILDPTIRFEMHEQQPQESEVQVSQPLEEPGNVFQCKEDNNPVPPILRTIESGKDFIFLICSSNCRLIDRTFSNYSV
ncbi:hypothetical protein ANN_16836 [Periplaneta americana]|uniref:Uncharacterized protein n=1 Tax=Periplaneta americana TaxID=6978 RepID=A0ABQ8SR82_PERAM|nr:hypothetical protein ANN_16836 [Periplaneta americana]